ncbi:MAG: 2,3-diphosphoglycerate-dependent phosphoglycerate mutase [DPANN group archaeon]|nr:2,3-diphosphoglycerate-dependent phosphoglycerate mutase [DPANN group archaeon]
MIQLVLLRHGESTWNKEGKFTGWTDVPLSEKGREEAKKAGNLLKEAGYIFDLAYTSVLSRAKDTLSIVLEELGLSSIGIFEEWRLNERHYGALQGRSKKELVKEVGEDQVFLWRRSYDVPPPPLTKDDPRYPGKDTLYEDVEEKDLPLTESLKDTVHRVIPYWNEVIAPSLQQGRKVIIVAHGNSLRALVKHLDNISDEDIPRLNIPTGIPLVYELDETLRPLKHHYLGDPAEASKAAEAVRQQI